MEIDGFTTWGKDNLKLPVSFCDGKLTFHAMWDEYPLPEEGLQNLLVTSYDNKYHLMHLPTPLCNTYKSAYCENGFAPVISGNYSVSIDYVIEDINSDATYNKIVLKFPELEYFIPSILVISYNSAEKTATVGTKQYFEKEFAYGERNFKFILEGNYSYKSSNSTRLESYSRIIITDENGMNLNAVLDLVYKVKSLFVFLCNRNNVAVDEAELHGEYMFPEHYDHDGTIVPAKTHPTSARLYLFDRDIEEYESNDIVKHTINYGYVSSHFAELFSLILDGKISVNNIHPSYRKKKIYGLEQCLGITASFERYVRENLPKMRSDELYSDFEEAKKLIDAYIEDNELSGKKKKHFKGISKNLSSPQVSLSETISLVYSGYDGWKELKSCFEIDGEKLETLADEANKWRNELAHDKSSYSPTENTIYAIRLVEKMNYCIILRQAGYDDSQIKMIIDEILK